MSRVPRILWEFIEYAPARRDDLLEYLPLLDVRVRVRLVDRDLSKGDRRAVELVRHFRRKWFESSCCRQAGWPAVCLDILMGPTSCNYGEMERSGLLIKPLLE